MISVLHCRVLAFFSLYLTLITLISQSNLQGFCVSRYCSIFKIPFAALLKRSSIISHFLQLVKYFLKYFLFLLLDLSSVLSGDLFILPPFSFLVKLFCAVLCFAQNAVPFLPFYVYFLFAQQKSAAAAALLLLFTP